MKKYVVGILFFCCITRATFIIDLNLEEPRNTFAHSFMFTRPAYYNFSMIQATWHDFFLEKKGHCLAAIQGILFYQQSREYTPTKQYFLPNQCNTEVLIAGDAVEQDFFIRDVRAEWLNLPSTFRGILTINPKQKQTGFLLQYNQDLKKIVCSPLFKNAWFTISLPFVHVQNNFNPIQSNITGITDNTTTHQPQTILQAFNQPDWCYDRFPVEQQTSRGLAELRVDIGSTYLFKNQKYDQMAFYSAIIIPIAPSQDPRFIFSPFTGNNNHFGLGGGILTQFLLNRNPERCAWCFFANLEAVWLFHNREKRTFDLINKPWSRFMLFTHKDSPPGSSVPGVNVLTQAVKTTPMGIFDFSTGWRLQIETINIDLSYNIWGHAREKISLHNDCCMLDFTQYGIAGKGTITSQGKDVAASASLSTIQQQADDDLTFVTINQLDIDVRSGASAGALNQKAQVAVGIECKDKPVETFCAAGACFDFPYKNSALKTWSVWLKGGASF
jgi:hypothetical protein